MENNVDKVNEFFREYGQIFNRSLNGTPDVEAITGAYADCFIEAVPSGIHCAGNGEEFRKKIPQGFEFNRKVGLLSMNLLKTKTTELHPFHYMTRAEWRAHCRRNTDGQEIDIDFTVIYFTQMQQGAPKIFAYITDDERQLMKEKGLIEEAEPSESH